MPIERTLGTEKNTQGSGYGTPDLGACDLVKVECACGRTETLTCRMLATAGVGVDEKVLDLGTRLRCRECDAKGRAVVSVRWASGATLTRA